MNTAVDLPFLPREGSRQSSPPTASPLLETEEPPEITLGEALSPEGAVPFGMSRDALIGIVDRAQAQGFEIVTVAEGARRLGA